MKISLVTNNMGISDKSRFRHHILSPMLGLPVVMVAHGIAGLGWHPLCTLTSMGTTTAVAAGSMASLTEKICSMGLPTWHPHIGRWHSVVGSVNLIGCMEADA